MDVNLKTNDYLEKGPKLNHYNHLKVLLHCEKTYLAIIMKENKEALIEA